MKNKIKLQFKQMKNIRLKYKINCIALQYSLVNSQKPKV